jgi:hypothetical protein
MMRKRFDGVSGFSLPTERESWVSPALRLLAAFIASRNDPKSKAFRARLQAAGKATKLALKACDRKLLKILNAMVSDERNYEKQAA